MFMMSLLRRTEKPAQYYRRPVKPGKQFGLDSIELFQIFIFTLSDTGNISCSLAHNNDQKYGRF